MPELRINIKSLEDCYWEGYRKGLRHGVEHLFLMMHENEIETELNLMNIKLSDKDEE